MANKKINQLVAKTTIQSTDLFPLGDASTGQLFKKTIAELQAAIGGAVISVNGLVGTVVLDTDDIQELATPTNKYFTDARARGAISLTVTGNSGASTYNSSTGVLNVPTYTLAGLGGITASFLSGASGIAYNSSTGVITYTGTVFTDASIRALVSAGAGLSYNSSTGVFSYSGTVYTDASIRALISLTTTGNSGVSSYNNTTGVLNVPNYTLAGLGGISLTSLSGTAPITYNSSTGAIGITQANTSTNGFLSSTDWNTFNGKQSALTLGNVTEVASNVLMFPDGGTNKTIGNLSIQVVQSGASTNGYLSSTDWTTFNNKQGTVTLTTTGTTGASTFSAGTLNIPQYQGVITVTTTGTSGAATLTSNTLNIPQYQAVLTNPVTGTGTTGKLVKFTSSSAIGNSILSESGDIITQSATLPDYSLNYTDATSLGRIFFSESGTFKAAIQFIGSTFVATARRNALEIVNTTTGDLALGTGDARTFYIKNGGNVGIGTSSPTARLDVSSGALTGALIVGGDFNTSTGARTNATRKYAVLGVPHYTNAEEPMTLAVLNSNSSVNEILIGGGQSNLNAATSIEFYTASNNTTVTGTPRIIINSAGNVGIGTASPDNILHIAQNNAGNIGIAIQNTNASFSAQMRFLNATGTEKAAVTYVQSASQLVLFNNGYNAIVISSNGNTLLNTSTDNGERLYVSGSIRATGSITANSDVRLKKNIERIENALEKVSQISGYTYNTIYDQERHAGLIAQEVDKVLPEIVNTGNDGLMGLEYGNLGALFTEAIKELKIENDSLKARLSALEK
jgi:hypothetical protein